MKSNVDLTLRRDFLGSRNTLGEILGGTLGDLEHLITRHLTNSRVPWAQTNIRILNSDTEMFEDCNKDSKYYNLILTGTKKDREDKKLQRLYNSYTCERCGGILEKLPWRSPGSWNLCKKCNEEFEEKENRVCWRKYFEES